MSNRLTIVAAIEDSHLFVLRQAGDRTVPLNSSDALDRVYGRDALI